MLATIASSTPPTWQDYALTFGQMLAALAVMAAAAWAVAHLGRKRLHGRRKRRINLIDKMPLERGRSLWLVELDGQRLLIGSAHGSVRLVREVRSPKRGQDEKAPIPSPGPEPSEAP